MVKVLLITVAFEDGVTIFIVITVIFLSFFLSNHGERHLSSHFMLIYAANKY